MAYKEMKIDFKVGNIVRANRKISRVDGKVFIPEGETAKVIRVFQLSPADSQIVDVEFKGMKLIDIVCLDPQPFSQ